MLGQLTVKLCYCEIAFHLTITIIQRSTMISSYNIAYFEHYVSQFNEVQLINLDKVMYYTVSVIKILSTFSSDMETHSTNNGRFS